jgi:hypothetical protein
MKMEWISEFIGLFENSYNLRGYRGASGAPLFADKILEIDRVF